MTVPQTCYDATVVKRVAKEQAKKLIFEIVTIYDHVGSNLTKTVGPEADKEIYMNHLNHDDRKRTFDKGRFKYTEYIKDNHTIVFMEHLYTFTIEGFVKSMTVRAYWEGQGIELNKPTTVPEFKFTNPFAPKEIE